MRKSSKSAIKILLTECSKAKLVLDEDIKEAIACINNIPETSAIDQYRKRRSELKKNAAAATQILIDIR